MTGRPRQRKQALRNDIVKLNPSLSRAMLELRL